MEPSLDVAEVIPDTEAEGPGRRFAVWVQGCPMRCPGCCNPQMLPFGGGRRILSRELAERALSIPGLEGVSLLGGEPFAHAEGVLAFATKVRAGGLGVMVYTGFTLAEIEAKRASGEPFVGDLLATCDLLVDGRFERDRPERHRRWIGSENQAMHFLSARHDPADPRFRTPNTVELRLRGGELSVNGWPALAAAVSPWKRTPGTRT